MCIFCNRTKPKTKKKKSLGGGSKMTLCHLLRVVFVMVPPSIPSYGVGIQGLYSKKESQSVTSLECAKAATRATSRRSDVLVSHLLPHTMSGMCLSRAAARPGQIKRQLHTPTSCARQANINCITPLRQVNNLLLPKIQRLNLRD